jgi:hypothetical protein
MSDMVIKECPDCGALVLNKEKHSISHAVNPSGKWREFTLESN